MNIPDEVINQAAKAYFLASEAEMGFTDSTWFGETGATEETRRQFRWAAFQMAPVIAEWARKEALREAADVVHHYRFGKGQSLLSNSRLNRAVVDAEGAIRAIVERELAASLRALLEGDGQ